MGNKSAYRKISRAKFKKIRRKGLDKAVRARLALHHPEVLVEEERMKQEALLEEPWLSCQTDINKLVQRNGPKNGPLFSPEESVPDEEAGDVDDKRLSPIDIIAEELNPEENHVKDGDENKDIMIAEPIDIIAEELNPEENHVKDGDENKDIMIAEWVIHKQLCRCCHAEGNFTGLAELEEAEDCSLDQMLLSCFNIQLSAVRAAGAGALRALCGLCAARLRDARAFRRQVLAAEGHFRELYANNCIKVAAVDVIDTEVKEELSGESDGAGVDVINMEVNEELSRESDVEGDVMLEELEPNQQGEKTTSTESDMSAPKKKNGKPESVRKKFISKHTCKYCLIKMKSLVQLTLHKLNEHKIDERYKCNACDKFFNTKLLFNQHEEVYHKLGEKFKCTVCDYECYGKYPLRKHMVKHRVSKDFQCKYCNKAFLRKSTLNFHERIHTGDKRKTCAECGQAFVQKASLNYHMAKYHPAVSF